MAPPESGKSWLSAMLCAEYMAEGDGVLYWDYESDIDEFIFRLKLCGVTPETHNLQNSHYWRSLPAVAESTHAAVELIEKHNIRLVIIDSVNRSMATRDGDPNSAGSYNTWHNLVPDALKATGAAVILIDHVAKDKDSRGNYAAGTEQKLSQVDVSYGIELIEPFANGKDGTLGLRVLKDRPGGVKADAFGDGNRKRWGLVHIKDNKDIPPMHVDGETGKQTHYKRFEVEPWDRYQTLNTYPSEEIKAVSDFLIDWDYDNSGEYVPFQVASFNVKASDKLFKFCVWRLVEMGIVASITSEGGVEMLRINQKDGYHPKLDKYNIKEYDPLYKEKELENANQITS